MRAARYFDAFTSRDYHAARAPESRRHALGRLLAIFSSLLTCRRDVFLCDDFEMLYASADFQDADESARFGRIKLGEVDRIVAHDAFSR